MTRRTVRLTESQLRQIIREVIDEESLDEGIWDDIKGAFGGKRDTEKSYQAKKKFGVSLPKGRRPDVSAEALINTLYSKPLSALVSGLNDMIQELPGDAGKALGAKAKKIREQFVRLRGAADNVVDVARFAQRAVAGSAPTSEFLRVNTLTKMRDFKEALDEFFAVFDSLQSELKVVEREITGKLTKLEPPPDTGRASGDHTVQRFSRTTLPGIGD